MIRSFLCCLMLTGILVACKQQTNSVNLPDKSTLNEDLINVNKRVVGMEDQQIRDYINRQGWKMSETGTGLRFMIYHEGKGPQPRIGQIVSLKYETRLLNGNLIYSSDNLGLKSFKVGSGGVESGLEEAILLLSLGDKAKIILPSHLAFGLLGDQDKIPAKASLVYDIELVEIRNEEK